MSRDTAGRFRTPRSKRFIAFSWVCSLLSLGLLYFSCRVLINDIGGFRSCSANSSGLSIETCGRQAPNVGDLALALFFILCACLAVSLLTGSWRMTRRRK